MRCRPCKITRFRDLLPGTAVLAGGAVGGLSKATATPSHLFQMFLNLGATSAGPVTCAQFAPISSLRRKKPDNSTLHQADISHLSVTPQQQRLDF